MQTIFFYNDGTNFSSSETTLVPSLFDHSKLIKVDIASDVNSIGGDCFLNCSLLQTVIFNDPNSLTNIGYNSFRDINPNIQVTFYNAKNEKTILQNLHTNNYPTMRILDIMPICGFPVNTIYIYHPVTVFHYSDGSYSLNTDTVLTNTSYTIPSGYDIIGIYISPDVTYLSDSSGNDLGTGCFSDCTSLTDIIIPSNVKSIGANCFLNCTGLTKITIQSTITVLKNNCFSGCTNLTTVIIPNSVTSIGNNCFYGCSNLATVIIPDSVISIGDECFYACTNLSKLLFINVQNIENIGSNAFSGITNIYVEFMNATDMYSLPASASQDNFTNGIFNYVDTQTVFHYSDNSYSFSTDTLLTSGSYTIPSGYNLCSVYISPLVTSLEDYCFYVYPYSYLENVSFTSLLTSSLINIGSGALLVCSKLKSIIIPDKFITIKDYAFAYTGLESIVVPPSISFSFYGHQFDTCIDLIEFTVESSELIPSQLRCLGYWFFLNCSSLKVINLPTYVNSVFTFNNIQNFFWSACFYNCSSLTTVNIPNYITSLGPICFSHCIGLQTIIIPDSVTSISDNCFEYCPNLRVITISGSVSTLGNSCFTNCPLLHTITILEPSVLETIPSYCFNWCFQLQNVNIPSSVTKISEFSFYFCNSLVQISIPDSVIIMGNSCFQQCIALSNITLPTNSNFTYLSWLLFAGCSSLESVIIPNSVTNLTYACFLGCSSLINVTIPNSVTNVGPNCFQSCSNLQQIVLPDSVTSLGSFCFYECNVLNNVTLPNNSAFTSLPWGCFYNCNSLINIIIPASITNIDSYCFVGCSLQTMTLPSGITQLNSDCFNGCTYLINVIIPNSVTTLGNNCFNGCSSLTNITIPNSVTTLGNNCFNNCANLTSVTLSSSINFLSTNCFKDCITLTSIIIPSNITTIGNMCFAGCIALSLVIFENFMTITSIASNIFTDININTTVRLTGAYGIKILNPSIINSLQSIVTISPLVIYEYDIGCYNKGTCILVLKNKKNKYVKIENLKKGDLVKTYKHGYKAVELIGKKTIINNPNNISNCIYKYNDLIITGRHSILVDYLPNYILNNHNKTLSEFYKYPRKIDDKILLLCSDCDLFEPIINNNVYTIYHLVLAGDKINYGIYVNNRILSESISKIQFFKQDFESIL
jgi:hypothetical protein